MKCYRYVRMADDNERMDVLSRVERLGTACKEYRRIIREVAQAPSQAKEIDVLLKWKSLLSVDHRTGDRIYHDIKRTNSFAYSFAPKQMDVKPYAGSLDNEGEAVIFYTSVYDYTWSDLYMEVLQLCAYAFYHIAPMTRQETLVTPCSACDLAESYRLADEGKDEDE